MSFHNHMRPVPDLEAAVSKQSLTQTTKRTNVATITRSSWTTVKTKLLDQKTWGTLFLVLAGSLILQKDEPREHNEDTVQEGPVSFLTAEVPVEGVLEDSGQSMVKCYHCHSPEVVAVCHHCGRYLCQECQAKPFLTRLYINCEFDGLEAIEKSQLNGAHCLDHQHYTRIFWRFLAIALFFIGAFFLLHDVFGPGTALILISIILWAAGPWLHRYIVPALLSTNLPLFPRLHLSIQEKVTADFQIAEKSYLNLDGASGTIAIHLSLTPIEGERYSSYLARHESRTQPVATRFDAGFMALDNLTHVHFADTHWMERPGFLRFTDTVPEDFQDLCQKRGELQLVKEYRIAEEILREGPKWDREFPIWIMPNIADRGAGRILTLELRLNSSKIGQVMVEELVIDLPPELVHVERTDGWYDALDRRVVWGNVAVGANDTHKFMVEFAESAYEVGAILGTYRLVIDKYALSGLNVPLEHIWTATGTPLPMVFRGQGLVERKTIITGRLSIDPHVFGMQQEYTKTLPGTIKGAVPNQLDLALNCIVDCLTKDQVYIKQVVETPIRVAPLCDIDTQTRYWDILGRRYMDDIQPVDVHVVLSGIEAAHEGMVPGESPLKFELTLRSVVGLHDDETRKSIDSLCEALAGTIQKSIVPHVR